MFRFLSILIACGILTSCVTTQPGPRISDMEVQQASDRSAPAIAEMEIQQASDRFWTTRESGDASALAAQFTEEAILMVPGLPDAVGRSAVRDLLKLRFASARTTDFKVHRREIQVVAESAYELAWYSETHRGQGEWTRLEGRYLLFWKRGHDDRWRVHRYFYNFSAATPVSAPSK